MATIGLAETAAHQIAGEFSVLEATTVTVEVQGAADSGLASSVQLPWDVEPRLNRLNGVIAAGAIALVSRGEQVPRSVQALDPLARTDASVDLYVASPGLFDVVEAGLAAGRFFDSGHSERKDAVVVIGSSAAQRLGVHRLNEQPAIFLDQSPLVIIGVIEV